MRRLIAAAFLTAIAVPAFAADPYQGPAGFNWTGGYIGVFGGWSHSRTEATDVEGEEYDGSTPGATMSLNDDGVLLGVTAGYNFQKGNWVFGPEVELGWASNDGLLVENSDDGLFTEYGFYGTLAGRIGYAPDRTLFYAKGGLSFASMKNAGGEFDGIGDEDDDGMWGFDGGEAGFGDETRLGWTIGAGVEHALTNQWTVKAEYMFADFGSERYFTIDGQTDEPFDFDNQLHTVKLGINYRF